MYYVTIKDNGGITGFHFNSEKNVLNDNEKEITEEGFNDYIDQKLNVLKYKYENGSIVDNVILA